MKTRSSLLALVVAVAVFFSLPAPAAPIYSITIDTSLVAGSDGAIYLQFNPGSGIASITINPFSVGSGILWLSAIGSGDYAGGLNPPPLMLTNTYALNDYLQFLTFGDVVTFLASFDPGPSSSAIFSFAATGADGLTPILIKDPSVDYFLGDISFGEDGVFSVNNYNPDLVTIGNAIPEPSSIALLASGVGFLISLRLRRRT